MTTPAKRERQREARLVRLEAERRAARRAARRRRLVAGGVVGVIVVGVLLLIAALGGNDGGEEAVADQPAEAPNCPPAEKPAEPMRSFEAAPPRCIEDGVDYGAVVTTSKGEFTMDLLEGKAPETVNNFVFLTRYGYFDGDDFHRVAPGFVIQGGDPTGDPPGSGDPGYTIPDELPDSVDAYVEGSVAMANSGPDTGGSQWFVYTGPNPLPGPNYSRFGQVTEGLDVVRAIQALGTEDGPPSEPVAIESVEITESGGAPPG